MYSDKSMALVGMSSDTVPEKRAVSPWVPVGGYFASQLKVGRGLARRMI